MFSRHATEAVVEGQSVFKTKARGYDVLRDPMLNKGLVFTAKERDALGLTGLLGDTVQPDMEQGLKRAYEHYSSQDSDLAKHVYMWQLHDSNATLFYALMQRHLLEMLPVVYDPTVGEAIEKFSQVYTRPRGVFLSIAHPDEIEDRLRAAGAASEDVDLIVATDAEEILGIGDWGAGGVDICIGKLAVYTAAAGVNPHRVLPVMLDVGTDNEKLLADPMYIGNKHGRVRGKAYDDFIGGYIAAARKLFPRAVLHWEDFGSTNARRNLDRCRDDVATFNDDMQGTGAIAMSGLFNAIKKSGSSWSEQRVVIVGGGTAGCGIADQVRDQMVRDGLSETEANRNIWVVDLPGLLTQDMGAGLLDYQKPYARPVDEVSTWSRTTSPVEIVNESRWPQMCALQKDLSGKGVIALAAVVANVKPTVLIGTSTTPGTFTEEIVKEMASAVDRPIIFPLSNPTPLAEATPKQIIEWTAGQALICTGSPFDDVEFDGVSYKIGQANNAALYPGLGQGAIACRATKITDEMILAAAKAVASQADTSAPGAALLPSNADLTVTSSIVAVEVVKTAIEQGVNGIDVPDPVEVVRSAVWWPTYRPVIAE
jgi:malate dehydrogenase (oxaloacetate-decarboxylating)